MKKWISKFGLVGMMSLLLFSFTGMATEVNTANDALWQTTIVAEMHGDHAEMPVEEPAAAEEAPTLSAGDTAWMIVATILVLVMAIPGLALFYGGLVRSKNMLSVLMQVFVTFSLMSVLWVVLGYSLAFSEGNAYIGDLSLAFLKGITSEGISGTIPEYVFVTFQLTFFALTPALIVGAFAERIKFSSLLVFLTGWALLVYAPICHMVWGGGLISSWGAVDFAGGTVVHINAGIAALVGAIVIGKRIGYGKEAMAPHSLPLTMVGASLLWAGSGAIAGLVAITPACAVVGPLGAIVLGFVASLIAFWACTSLKKALGYDDSLDVFGIHGVAGIVGAIGLAVLMSADFGGVGYDEGITMMSQLWVQAKSVIFTIVWCGVISYVLFKIIDMVMGLRVTEEDERTGLDTTSHGETAYHS